MIKIQVLSYSELSNLNTNQRVKKILKLIEKDFVVVLSGKLNVQEKNELYKENLNHISEDLSFHGIEIAELFEQSNKKWVDKIKSFFSNALFGRELGMTLIGPADVIKEIKQNPSKIEILADSKK